MTSTPIKSKNHYLTLMARSSITVVGDGALILLMTYLFYSVARPDEDQEAPLSNSFRHKLNLKCM